MDVHVTQYSYVCIAAVDYIIGDPFCSSSFPNRVLSFKRWSIFVLNFHVLLLKVMFLCDDHVMLMFVSGWLCTLEYFGDCAAIDPPPTNDCIIMSLTWLSFLSSSVYSFVARVCQVWWWWTDVYFVVSSVLVQMCRKMPRTLICI